MTATISTERARMDVAAIHAFACTASAAGISSPATRTRPSDT